MGKCEKCLYYKSKTKCGECGRLSNAMDNNPMFTPNTNYDRIKSMSVDEMVDLLENQVGCGRDSIPCGVVCNGKCTVTKIEDCKEKIKQWLLQEVSEDE